MSITAGDLVFSREGKPVEVKDIDKKSGKIKLNTDSEKVQSLAENGIKNGLPPDSKAAFNTILSSAKNADKRAEIEELSQKIEELKKDNSDPRLIRYLKGELQFRMTRERYEPANYKVDANTLIGS